MWCIKSENKGQASPPTPLQRERGVVCFVAYGCVIVCVLGLFSTKTLREFGIRKIRYANYRVAVGLLIGQGWEQRRPTLPK